MEEKYTLVGIDGNAFAVMGFVSQCMKREGFTLNEVHEYYKQAQSSDYNNLIYVSLDYIDKCNERYVERHV